MKKRILALFLSILMLFSLIPMTASADGGSGTCEDGLEWSLDSGGTLTISGTGAMMDYSSRYYSGTFATSAPWGQYYSDIKSVAIEDGVTSIGSSAFEYCSSLTSVSIPNSVTSIGDYAFQSCSKLTSVTIPNSVTSIGDYAFSFCHGLTSVSIPNSVTSIGSDAFFYCSSLASLEIGASVTIIGSEAFYDCSSLESILVSDNNTVFSSFDGVLYSKDKTQLIYYPARKTAASYSIPSFVTSIGEHAFYDCYALTSVVIPNSVTSIGNSAFEYCSSLTSVSIPDSVTSIGSSAFSGCSRLENVVVSDNNTVFSSFDGVLYSKDKTRIIYYPAGKTAASYSIPSFVTSIGEHAFYDCYALTSVVIPNSVTSIGNSAFSYCSNLTSVSIPDSVTSIGNSAFEGCYGLTSVTIGNSVTSIGSCAFFGCSSLTSVTIPDSVTSIGVSAFGGTALYNNSSNWEDGVLYIGNHLIEVNTDTKNFFIKEGTLCIADYAFWSCSSLETVTIPDSVKGIGGFVFVYCGNMTGIYVSDDNKSFCSFDGVLYNKDKTKIICFPAGKTEASFSIPDSVTSIGSAAFCFCSSLTSVEIPDSVTSIGYASFGLCSSLESVTIPNSVTSIGSYAFSECSSLSDVYFIGTEEEWDQISIDNSEGGNDPLLNASIHFMPKEECSHDFSDGVCTLCGALSENIRFYLGLSSGDTVDLIINDEYNALFRLPENGMVNTKEVTIKTALQDIPSLGADGVLSKSTYQDTSVLGNHDISLESFLSNAYSFNGGSINLSAYGKTAAYELYMIESENKIVAFTDPDDALPVWQTICSDISVSMDDDLICVKNGSYIRIGSERLELAGESDFEAAYTVLADDLMAFFDNATIEDCEELNGIEIFLAEGSKLVFGGVQFTAEEDLLLTISADNIISELDGCLSELDAGENMFQMVLKLVRLFNTAVGTVDSADEVNIVFGLPHEHCFDQEIIAPEYLKTPASCTAKGIYYKSCTCGETGTDTFESDFGEHTYVDGICTVCGGEEARIIASGTCGAWPDYSSVSWALNSSGTLTISGTGEMDSSPWKSDYSDSIKKLVIEDGVTSIGYDAFAWCSSLTSVTIPDSVTSIGYAAFYYCSSLTSVTIPNSVTSIESYAFYGCSSLTSVTIPNSVTSVGDWAFYNCSSLTSVTIPDSVTSIGGYAFHSCSKLKSVALPDGIKTIEVSVFSGCTRLMSITLPSSLESIGDDAFNSCGSLASISFPKSLKSIGRGAFMCCDSLTSIVIPKNVESIGNYAFSNCDELLSLEIYNAPLSIAAEAFAYCYKLSSVDLGNAATKIGDRAFLSCYELIGLNIPSSVTEIGVNPIAECSKSVLTLEDSDHFCLLNGVLYTKDMTKLISYPRNKTDRSFEIPETVTEIGDYAFDYNYNLAEISLPDGLKTIGASAFPHCFSLKEIEFPSGIEKIGSQAFYNCSGFSSLVIPAGAFIDAYAFAYCNSLTSITFEEGRSSIPEYAFSGCSALKTLYLPSTLTMIELGAFDGCSSISDIYFEGTIEQWEAVEIDVRNVSISKANLHIEHEHSFADAVTEPTCTKKGYTTHTCTICGKVEIDKYVNALGHSFGDWAVKTPAGCFDDGVEARYCEECNISETRAIPAAHSYTESIVDPCCTAMGYTKHICTLCGHSYLSDFKNMTEHSYNDTVIDPTCTSTGYTKHTCSVCGISYIDNITPCSAHNFGEWQIAMPASCVQVRIMARLCPDCGALEAVEENYSSHNYENGVCTVCGKSATAKGSCGEALTWSLNEDGMLRIDGSGEVSSCPWSSFAKAIKTVAIDSGVTAIMANAFEGCDNLSDVYYIGAQTQWDAISIGIGNELLISSSLHIPDSTKSVSASAESVTELSIIPVGDTVLPEGAKLTVEEAKPADIQLVINEKPNLKFTAYEINLTDENGGAIQPENGVLVVSIGVPEDYEAEDCRVYRVEDGKLVDMHAKLVGGKLQFTTEHFSTYIVAKEPSHTHSFSEVWDWSSDGKSVKLTLTCDCSEGFEQNLTLGNGIISGVESAASCKAMGVTKYSASVEYEGETYTSSKSITDIAKTAHHYENGKCTVCGEADPNYDPAPGGNDDGGNFFSRLLNAIRNIFKNLFSWLPFC